MVEKKNQRARGRETAEKHNPRCAVTVTVQTGDKLKEKLTETSQWDLVPPRASALLVHVAGTRLEGRTKRPKHLDSLIRCFSVDPSLSRFLKPPLSSSTLATVTKTGRAEILQNKRKMRKLWANANCESIYHQTSSKFRGWSRIFRFFRTQKTRKSRDFISNL